jgi:hypothetical protein
MPDFSCRRVFLFLLGVTCLLVLLIYTYQQGLWSRTLLIERIFLGGNGNNVSAHTADDFSEGINSCLSEAADEDVSTKNKDDIEEGQVMYFGRKFSFIQVSHSAHTLY